MSGTTVASRLDESHGFILPAIKEARLCASTQKNRNLLLPPDCPMITVSRVVVCAIELSAIALVEIISYPNRATYRRS
ncbi:MAG: hypothetical protein H6R16_2190 [Proteobacteria bacterium]|nr:hypothetical protein [Pseudomonadota bacterium]